MDIKKFEINLKKINTLKQNIDLSGEEISKLEIELLKNYIKKLFESVALDEDLEDEEEVVEIVKKKKKKKKKEVVVEEIEEEEAEDEVVEEAVGQDKESEVKEEVEELQYDEELLAIFDTDRSSELSDKLSSTPIADIKKAIGINDRIFTINELFGGDKDLFNSTVEQLNGLESFEQARDHLLQNIALEYNWSKADNLKKAKRFIKVIKRRFGVL